MKILTEELELECQEIASADILLPVEHALTSIAAIAGAWRRDAFFIPVPEPWPQQDRERALATLGPQEQLVRVAKQHNICCMVMSSGSSGWPKFVAFQKENFRLAARAHAEVYGLAAQDVWLSSLPLYHIGGLAIVIRALELGQKLAFPKDREISTLRWWMQSGRIQGLSLVPTQLKRLLEFDSAWRPHANVKVILVGGAALDARLHEAAKNRGFAVVQSYGLTETCAQVWAGEKALAPMQLRVGDTGELQVKGPHLAAGYWQQHSLVPLPLTADGFFATGDLGSFAGQQLQVHGRKSELIISGGVNVDPKEIEQCLLRFVGIEDASVFALPDLEWGERIVAAIVSARGANLSLTELRKYLAEQLLPAKRPKEFFQMSAIPRSVLGKVYRQKLVDAYTHASTIERG